LATGSTASGRCQPDNQYTIYNYYCVDGSTEQTLQTGSPCATVTAPLATRTCECVEAFIDTITRSPPWGPVFYRCYWYTPLATNLETVAFEWSATSEYIEWYVKNIASASPAVPNSVDVLIGGAVTPTGFLVPLLKVTNHSPSLF
jgi:hypothetical protein